MSTVNILLMLTNATNVTSENKRDIQSWPVRDIRISIMVNGEI